MYVRDVRTGITVSDREPEILKENAATAHVDGCNLLGPVVGNFCMDVAIQKAKTAGVGWVVAKGTHGYAYYLAPTNRANLITMFTRLIIYYYTLSLILLYI